MSKKPWEYTEQEWDALPSDEQDKLFVPVGGARPSNTNYHYCSLDWAISQGIAVESRVLESIHPFNRKCLERNIESRAKEKHNAECRRIALEKRNVERRQLEDLYTDVEEFGKFVKEDIAKAKSKKEYVLDL